MPRQPTVFERDVLLHLDAAYALARWLTRDAALAQDVVQDAMLRAWRFHAGLRGAAKPWLLQIVRNAAYARTAGRRSETALDEVAQAGVPDPGPDPEAALHQRERCQALDRALAALPDELRECILLREVEAMSYKEIAQVTGVPVGTVMSRLFRGRQVLIGTAR